jgi:hypothetical protein
MPSGHPEPAWRSYQHHCGLGFLGEVGYVNTGPSPRNQPCESEHCMLNLCSLTRSIESRILTLGPQDLVSRFSTTDPKVNIGVLEVAHSIFVRWRPLFRTDELYTEINHVITTFDQPFVQLLAASLPYPAWLSLDDMSNPSGYRPQTPRSRPTPATRRL